MRLQRFLRLSACVCSDHFLRTHQLFVIEFCVSSESRRSWLSDRCDGNDLAWRDCYSGKTAGLRWRGNITSLEIGCYWKSTGKASGNRTPPGPRRTKGFRNWRNPVAGRKASCSTRTCSSASSSASLLLNLLLRFSLLCRVTPRSAASPIVDCAALL